MSEDPINVVLIANRRACGMLQHQRSLQSLTEEQTSSLVVRIANERLFTQECLVTLDIYSLQFCEPRGKRLPTPRLRETHAYVCMRLAEAHI